MGLVVKKVLDIIGASAAIILCTPLFILISVLIRLDSTGPVFFLQRRCGLGGREFEMYKFRSMVEEASSLRAGLKNEAEGPVFKLNDDPRITRAGRILRRTSMDELPQLLNVLKGEMSLVGPRPLTSEEMNGNDEWRKVRLSVKPGITGLWQVKARDSRSFDDWVRYDTEYVKKRSLLTDMGILFKTIRVVISGRGAV